MDRDRRSVTKEQAMKIMSRNSQKYTENTKIKRNKPRIKMSWYYFIVQNRV